jgi:maltose alpha-D-glucosyltransferase/alpha-amylase
VYIQENDPNSLLQHVRKLVAIRKAHPALQASTAFEILFASPGRYPLVFQRADDDETIIIAINPSSQTVEAELPSIPFFSIQPVYGPEGIFTRHNNQWIIKLPPISGGIYRGIKS